jgi:hypothetical protein
MTGGLSEILDEQDRRDLHGAPRPAVRVNHLGMSGRTVREVLAAVSSLPRAAVRSGHIGNWTDVWRGRVGIVDYNRYICRDLGLGVPVLHAHTFTETRDLNDGDTIYLPGGRIVQGRYERLDLFVKEGTRFRPVADGESVCCAFAFVRGEDGIEPLLAVRTREVDGIPGAGTIPTLLTSDGRLLRDALTALVTAADGGAGGLTLEQVFGSSVNRQGLRGGPPRRSGSGFEVEGTRYGSSSALVEAAVMALEYGSTGHLDHHAQAQPTGEYLPLLGAAALLTLTAHWDCRGGSDGVHAHWGAISMSGHPPLSQGYFGRQATRRLVRLVGEAMRPVLDLPCDVRFALLPAPLLSLLPPAEFVADCEAVDELFRRVLERTTPPGADPSAAQEQISQVVTDWLAGHEGVLSDYYLSRFRAARSIVTEARRVPDDGSPADVARLGQLTMQQASMVLGALLTRAGARDRDR